MRVADYMTSTPVTANMEDGLRQTFYRMRERHVRHMPVLDDQERVVGIISDRDLRRPDWVDNEENVAHYYILDNRRKVREAMTTEPYTTGAEDDLAQALAILVEHGFGALPVVDGSRRLIGILSAYDCLRAFAQQLNRQ